MKEIITFREFSERYGSDDACLDELFTLGYGKDHICPKCNSQGRFSRVKSRKCYSCSCGYQVYPMRGTIFESSKAPLSSWFYLMFLMQKSKKGVSASEVQREFRSSYKTVWRMGHKVRELMREERGTQLSGIVEIDETFYGGKAPDGSWGGMDNKETIFGLTERGGRALAYHVEGRTAEELLPIIYKKVAKGTVINTDGLSTYSALGNNGYVHKVIHHSRKYKKGRWAVGGIYTNTIEGFWSQLKKSFHGTYNHVGMAHLQSYLDEFCFRYNRRHEPGRIFEDMLGNIYSMNPCIWSGIYN